MSWGLASRASAIIAAAIGADALVPVCLAVHIPLKVYFLFIIQMYKLFCHKPEIRLKRQQKLYSKNFGKKYFLSMIDG